MKQQTPLVHIEISKSNLVHNIKALRSVAKKGAEFVASIKGNAYGHGQNEVAEILASYVDYFFVNSYSELRVLRKVTKKPTFVLGYVAKVDLKKAMQLGCILTFFSIEQLKKISAIANGLKIKQVVHLPIDAHLGREGFLLEDLPNIFKEIKKCKNIKLSGIYSHFANIEDTKNFEHAEKQIKYYAQALNMARSMEFPDLKTHISATSGLLVYEKSGGVNNLVRTGIGLYGMWPSTDIERMYKGKIELKPVLSLKTKVAQVKTLSLGSTVGYGLTHTVKKSTKVALLPIGYADGLDRRMSNNGYVLIHEKKCKILGRISMNMTVVDISEVSNVDIEDEVVLIGRQGEEVIKSDDIAKSINTINYEVTTRLSALLPKVCV